MQDPSKSIGRLSPNAVPNSLIDETIEFIWRCLVPWRDDPERLLVEGEEDLNAQLHNFLQARANSDFPMVLFQHEQRQEGRRRVDLSAKPIEKVIIEGVTYTKYQPILVIEGKRLPAPSATREREYVTGKNLDISGGLQRFKLGLHGKNNKTAILLGYIQMGQAQEWHSRINEWITDLAKKNQVDWAEHEILAKFSEIHPNQKYRTSSRHSRNFGCCSPHIDIIHFWVQLTQI